MSKKRVFRKVKVPKRRAFYALAALVAPLVIFFLVYWERVYPNVFVAGQNLAGLSVPEAAKALEMSTKPPEKIVVADATQTFEIPLSEIDFAYDFTKTGQRAFGIGRSGNLLFDLDQIVKVVFDKKRLGLLFNLNEDKLDSFLASIAGAVSVEPTKPSAKIEKGALVIEEGKTGVEVDKKELRLALGEALAFGKFEPLAVPKKTIDPRLSEEEKERFTARAEKLKNKVLNVSFEFTTFTYKGSALLSFLDGKEGFDEEKVGEVSEEIANKINREPQDPTFVFKEGRVAEFAPSKDGIATKIDELKEKLKETLARLEEGEKELSFEVPVKRTESKMKTGEVNDLGIKELIGRGTSRFRGSIASRIYNINLAAIRLNGVLIKPDQVFSFNDALGDVSKLTGYKEAYVIRDGKTVLGDGGGVCQVSTTLFRAVMNAGLPIIERRAHAYRVGYYEQDSAPGLDATVYGPTTDFKFKNDTGHHILIQAYPDTKNLTLAFELYGTSDGRKATVSKPVVTNVTAPPADLYIDDPTLPAGVIKQTEHRAFGARATFNYEVTREGEVIYQKTFISNYRPWQAVYLRGIGPAN